MGWPGQPAAAVPRTGVDRAQGPLRPQVPRVKKLVPKNLLAKAINVYFQCADGQADYPTDGGGGDAITTSHTSIEETIFVKKNKTFNVTDTSTGDIDSGSFNLQGRFTGRTASGTLRMENHRNDGSNHGDYLTCDTGVLPWTATAP